MLSDRAISNTRRTVLGCGWASPFGGLFYTCARVESSQLSSIPTVLGLCATVVSNDPAEARKATPLWLPTEEYVLSRSHHTMGADPQWHATMLPHVFYLQVPTHSLDETLGCVVGRGHRGAPAAPFCLPL